MTDSKLPVHGRSHRSGGSDPIPVRYEIKVFADDVVVSTGNGKFIFPVTYPGKLIDVYAYVTTESSSGKPTVQIRNYTQAVDMLTTKITIDANEFSSRTAATPPEINATNALVVEDDQIGIDVDVSGTGAMGLGVILTFLPS